MKQKKLPLILIILGFLVSASFSFYIVQKYDKNFITSDGNISHYLIKGDAEYYFEEASLIKNQLKDNVNFLETGFEYKASFLHPRILAIFFSIIDEDIKINSPSNEEIKIFNSNNKKLLFLLFQSLVFYLSIYIFFKKAQKKINYKILLIVILFLCFEPTIIQFNSSFLTESIYFSLLILLLALLIDLKKSFITNVGIGLLIGIMYLQRTVSLYLILPIIIYYIFCFKNLPCVLKSIFFIVIGQIVVLTFLGYSNYKRADIFYISPWQTKFAMYHYITDDLISKANKIDPKEAKKKRITEKKIWIEDNKIDLDKEKDRRKLYNYYQGYFFEKFKTYPYEGIKIVVWKSLQTGILDPGFVYSYIHQDRTIKKYWKINNLFELPEKIIYSLMIYLFSFIGFVYCLKKKNNLTILFLLIGLYHISVLGWTGVSRYSVPSLICISLFFANGVFSIKLFHEKNNFNSLFKRK